MNWYTAERVTVSSGSTIVRVVSGESVAAIRAHDGLEINSFNAVDIELTYTEEGTGDQVIQLVRPWPHASQTEQAAQVVPTAAHFNDSVQVLTNTYEHVFAQLGSYFSFGTQATGNVTFKAVRVDESDVTVRCINQWDADLSALEASASSSVADLNAIDTAINGSGGLVEVAAQVSDDLEAVDAVLSGYVATAKTYRDNALTYRNTAENYRDEAEGLRDTTYSYRNEVSGWHTSISGWKTAAESARDLAEQYRDEAEAFKNQAGQIVGGNYVDQSTTVNGKALSGNITLNADDIGLPNVDNTSDADKPVSTATQLALDDKADNSSVSNIDNTSDADKPVSTATQAALDALETSIGLPALQSQIDKVRKLALAGL